MRINPDLAMFNEVPGSEMLKNTTAANPFTASGNPNPNIDPKDAKVPTVRRADVFDPGTGDVRAGGADDIACWFIDTDYDSESVFVRHADFLGANGPYAKFGKALRVETGEGAWAKVYGATSRPFDPPTTGKVAVKMINHFGCEVLTVHAVPVKIPAATGKSKKQT